VTVRQLGAPHTGVLYVVSLPIGNDDDLSPRARAVLERVDLVLAEDTRRLQALATRVGMHPAATLSYHDHNERDRADEVLSRLEAGARIALVSDAGTPMVNDPGYVVVSRAVAAGHPVSPVPGPSAPLAALTASGLPSDRFVYAGFLPRRSAARQKSLRGLAAAGMTIVCLEAPGRVADLLVDVATALPEWRVTVAREITKVFEEFRHGDPAVLAEEFADDRARGEFTIVLAPPVTASERDADEAEGIDDLLKALLDQGVTATTLVRALSSLPGTSRKEAYARVLELGKEQ
jgi:16S rRNA (cytidine1402-2'-O)-methyltransferase